MTYQKPLAFLLLVTAATGLACSNAAEPPTSPTALEADVQAVGYGLKVSAPRPVSPAEGIVVDDDDPELVIENASVTFADSPPLAYVFQVFDAEERLVYESAPVPAGDGGMTTHEIGVTLEFDRAFSWRAYASYDGAHGPLSAGAAFRTFNRYGPSCAHLGSELAITQCRRAQYGFMSVPERVEFLRRIAYDLNRASAEHAPYGILVKSTGHNCLGYSCDIICSNTGMHRQWDVLSDEDSAQVPVWRRLDRIAPRPCEAVQ